jgi:tRNA/rRNA methyltransferase
MSNFGVEQLRVVSPYDVAFREARSAVGSVDLLARAEEYKDVADAIADCSLVIGTASVKHREVRHPVYALEHAGALIRERLQSGTVALLFGSEKVGLLNRDLSHCHWLLRIRTREEHSSMNLAQAVAVCLYEIVRKEEGTSGVGVTVPATARELERITELQLETLYASGYLKTQSAVAEEKIRRLVLRLGFNQDDAQTWLGMLRQIAWRLKQGRDVGGGGRNRT